VELDIRVTDHGDRTVVSVGGEVDAYTAPTLETALGEVIPTRSVNVVVDLSDVTFLDSTGLGVLVSGLNRTEAHGGSYALVVTNHRVLRIFELSSLTQLFQLHDSLEAALAAA
jgi:anti-sigma B factor antagonist